MAAFFFGSPVDMDVKLEGEDDRKQVEVKQEKEKNIRCPVYYDGESVVGQVCSRQYEAISYFAHWELKRLRCAGDYPSSGWKEVHA